MRLCHSTDQQGRDGIERQGFRQPDPPIGPRPGSPEHGRVWFGSSKQVVRDNRHARSGWWVWIEVPDDTLEYAFDDGTTMPGIYALPIDYVNGLDMEFEPDN